jgi:5-methylcytosine-specific restriction protein A
LCRECGKRGIVKAADEVHHVVPLAAGGTHDESNLVPLCKACHSRHTAREGGGFGNAGGKVAKACTVDGAPVDDRHHWNR